MILLDDNDKPIKNAQSNKQEYFSQYKESGLGKAARVGYNALKHGLSSAAGFIPEAYNLMAGVGDKISDYISSPGILDQYLPDVLQSPQRKQSHLPRIPEGFTSSGIRENVFNPIGDKIFGKGSMGVKPGMLESVLNRSAELAPLMMLGGASIPRSLGFSGVQAAAGETAKQLGVGEGGQMLAELAGASIPAIYKTAISRAVPKAAKIAESGLWKKAMSEASSAPKLPTKFLERGMAEKVPTNFFSSARKRLVSSLESLDSSDRKVIETSLGEIEATLGKKSTTVEKLINATRKISNTIPHIKAKGGKGAYGRFRKEINAELDNVLNSYKEARSISKAIIENPYLNKDLKNTKNLSDSTRSVMSAIKMAAVPTAAKVAGPWGAAGALGAIGAAHTAKNAAQDIKLLKSSPALRKMFESFARDTAAGGASVVASKAGKIAKKGYNKKHGNNRSGSTMRLID